MTKLVPVPTYGASFEHRSHVQEACIMEMVDYVYNDEETSYLSDTPACTSKTIALIAAAVNDALPTSERHHIMRDFDRLFGTANADGNAEFERKVNAFFVDSFGLHRNSRFDTDWVNANADDDNFYVMTEYLAGDMEDYHEIAGILTQILDIYDEVFGPRIVPEQDLSVFYTNFGFDTAIIDE